MGDEILIRHIPPDPESAFRGDALIIRDAKDDILVAYSAVVAYRQGYLAGASASVPPEGWPTPRW